MRDGFDGWKLLEVDLTGHTILLPSAESIRCRLQCVLFAPQQYFVHMSEEVEITNTYSDIEQHDAVKRYSANEWEQSDEGTQFKLAHNGMWIQFERELQFRTVGKFPRRTETGDQY